jgi:membrane-bound lytic murein transglycosylase MltF
MKFIFLIIFIQFVSLTSVHAAERLKIHLDKVEYGGLEDILKRKHFRALTTRNPYDYYMYQGKTRGIQYEMIKEFTRFC